MNGLIARLAMPLHIQQTALPAENHYYGLKFFGCLVLAIIFLLVRNALSSHGGFWVGGLLQSIPLVLCLLFAGLAVYNLFCSFTANEPYSGPPG